MFLHIDSQKHISKPIVGGKAPSDPQRGSSVIFGTFGQVSPCELGLAASCVTLLFRAGFAFPLISILAKLDRWTWNFLQHAAIFSRETQTSRTLRGDSAIH